MGGCAVSMFYKTEKFLNVARRSLDFQNLNYPPWRLPKRLQRLIKLVKTHTVQDILRLSMLYGLAFESKQIDGDIVECGVFRGGSAAVLAAATKDLNVRKIWLYDVFEGMPSPNNKDGEFAKAWEGELISSVVEVKEVFEKVKIDWNNVIIRKGLFKDTFKEQLPAKVALLHIDADWYESVLLALRAFYPLLVEGGIVVLDDFGHWEGTREAFYDFCMEEKIKPLIERVGYTQAFWRKGQESTRDKYDNYWQGVYSPELKGER